MDGGDLPPNLPGLPPACAQPGLPRELNLREWEAAEARSLNQRVALVREMDADWVFYLHREHLEHPWRRVSEYVDPRGPRRGLLLQYLARP
jgi:hypothetical protein